MSNINSLNNSLYYSLTGQQNSNNSTSSATGASSNLTLADILNSSANNSGDVVDLSTEAQNYLNSLNSLSSTNAISSVSGDGQSTNFILTNSQRQKLNEILEKYKDEPFTQDTFNQIQNDLQAAGLSPDQLSKLDQVNSFNPTQVFIDIIDGKQTDVTSNSSTSDSDKKTKSTNYINQILQQLKGISSTVNDTNSTASSDS